MSKNDDVPYYHKSRGAKSLLLKIPQETRVDLPNDVFSFDMVVPKVRLKLSNLN